MSTSNIQSIALTAALFAAVPAVASDAWHLAPGEAGFTYHPEHVQSTLTREQFLSRWADERRTMAGRGYKWDQLYGTYVFVGPGSPPLANTMSREQVLASEAEQDRQMRAKGMKWNQLFGVYQPAR